MVSLFPPLYASRPSYGTSTEPAEAFLNEPGAAELGVIKRRYACLPSGRCASRPARDRYGSGCCVSGDCGCNFTHGERNGSRVRPLHIKIRKRPPSSVSRQPCRTPVSPPARPVPSRPVPLPSSDRTEFGQFPRRIQ